MSYINIHQAAGKRSRFYKTVASNAEFFQKAEYLIVNSCEDCIEFKIPSIDYNGKQYKVSKIHSGWTQISVPGDLPMGTHFEFDEEESNEDRVVVYFKQNQE